MAPRSRKPKKLPSPTRGTTSGKPAPPKAQQAYQQYRQQQYRAPVHSPLDSIDHASRLLEAFLARIPRIGAANLVTEFQCPPETASSSGNQQRSRSSTASPSAGAAAATKTDPNRRITSGRAATDALGDLAYTVGQYLANIPNEPDGAPAAFCCTPTSAPHAGSSALGGSKDGDNDGRQPKLVRKQQPVVSPSGAPSETAAPSAPAETTMEKPVNPRLDPNNIPTVPQPFTLSSPSALDMAHRSGDLLLLEDCFVDTKRVEQAMSSLLVLNLVATPYPPPPNQIANLAVFQADVTRALAVLTATVPRVDDRPTNPLLYKATVVSSLAIFALLPGWMHYLADHAGASLPPPPPIPPPPPTATSTSAAAATAAGTTQKQKMSPPPHSEKATMGFSDPTIDCIYVPLLQWAAAVISDPQTLPLLRTAAGSAALALLTHPAMRRLSARLEPTRHAPVFHELVRGLVRCLEFPDPNDWNRDAEVTRLLLDEGPLTAWEALVNGDPEMPLPQDIELPDSLVALGDQVLPQGTNGKDVSATLRSPPPPPPPPPLLQTQSGAPVHRPLHRDLFMLPLEWQLEALVPAGVYALPPWHHGAPTTAAAFLSWAYPHAPLALRTAAQEILVSLVTQAPMLVVDAVPAALAPPAGASGQTLGLPELHDIAAWRAWEARMTSTSAYLVLAALLTPAHNSQLTSGLAAWAGPMLKHAKEATITSMDPIIASTVAWAAHNFATLPLLSSCMSDAGRLIAESTSIVLGIQGVTTHLLARQRVLNLLGELYQRHLTGPTVPAWVRDTFPGYSVQIRDVLGMSRHLLPAAVRSATNAHHPLGPSVEGVLPHASSAAATLARAIDASAVTAAGHPVGGAGMVGASPPLSGGIVDKAATAAFNDHIASTVHAAWHTILRLDAVDQDRWHRTMWMSLLIMRLAWSKSAAEKNPFLSEGSFAYFEGQFWLAIEEPSPHDFVRDTELAGARESSGFPGVNRPYSHLSADMAMDSGSEFQPPYSSRSLVALDCALTWVCFHSNLKTMDEEWSKLRVMVDSRLKDEYLDHIFPVAHLLGFAYHTLPCIHKNIKQHLPEVKSARCHCQKVLDLLTTNLDEQWQACRDFLQQPTPASRAELVTEVTGTIRRTALAVRGFRANQAATEGPPAHCLRVAQSKRIGDFVQSILVLDSELAAMMPESHLTFAEQCELAKTTAAATAATSASPSFALNLEFDLVVAGLEQVLMLSPDWRWWLILFRQALRLVPTSKGQRQRFVRGVLLTRGALSAWRRGSPGMHTLLMGVARSLTAHCQTPGADVRAALDDVECVARVVADGPMRRRAQDVDVDDDAGEVFAVLATRPHSAGSGRAAWVALVDAVRLMVQAAVAASTDPVAAERALVDAIGRKRWRRMLSEVMVVG